MISKTHISAQKVRRRQLNAKVCGSIFLILFVKTTKFNNDILKIVQVLAVILIYHKTDAYHSAELYDHLASS